MSRKNTLRMMETLTSIAGLGEETYKRELGGGKSRDWQRRIMRWSGLRRQAYIVQQG